MNSTQILKGKQAVVFGAGGSIGSARINALATDQCAGTRVGVPVDPPLFKPPRSRSAGSSDVGLDRMYSSFRA